MVTSCTWAYCKNALCRKFVKIELLLASCQAHQILPVQNSPLSIFTFYPHFRGIKNFHFCIICVIDVFRLCKNAPTQRFSNWGPRTKGGPRRVPTGSARGFQKVVIVCTVFTNLRPICFQICTHKSVTQSQCINCVEVLPWFGTTGFL